jgi:outer membrane protein TolC
VKFFLVLLLAAPASAQTERTFTLEDAVRTALQNDSRLLSAQQDRIISDIRVKEALYRFLPEFGLQASATKYEARYPFSLGQDFRNILLFPGADSENFYSGRGYATLSLYEGGRQMGTLRLAKAAQKQASSAYESVKMDVRRRVKETFYRALERQERQAALSALGRETERLLQGGLGGYERVEAEALLSTVRSRVSEAEHELALARLDFIRALNIEQDSPFRLVGVLDAKPVDLSLKNLGLWAMELRPELQSETYKAEMDAISVNLAQGRRIPSVFLAGDYEVNAQRFPLRNNNWSGTLGVRIPFSYDYFTQLRSKRAEQRQGQLNRAALQDRVKGEVREAHEKLLYWQRELPLRETAQKRVQQLYDNASGGGLPRLRALVAMSDVKLAWLAAVTEHLLAQARLERAVGRELK